MPYKMPYTMNFEAMMDKAIAADKAVAKKSRFVLLRWISASAAAVAVIVLSIAITSSPAIADPSTEYNAAIKTFCDNASNEQMEMQMNMATFDVVNNMDIYQEYYN